MSFHIWLAFVATSCVVLALLGPTAFIVLRYSAELSRGRLVRVISGAVLGDALALTICNFGLGALRAASSGLLTALKLTAAAYLIGIGLATLFKRPAPASAMHACAGRPFLDVFDVFLVTALNPKGIAFFCALLPQFVDDAQPIIPQLALLQVTFCTLSLVAASTWSLIGLSLRRATESSALLGRLLHRGSGLLLISAGVAQAVGRLAWAR